MEDLSKINFWNNSIIAWIIALGVLIGSFIIIRIIKTIALKRLKIWSAKTATSWDDFLVDIIEKSAVPMLYIFAVYFSINTLTLPVKVVNVIHVAFLVCITYFVLKAISASFKKLVYSYIQNQEHALEKQQQASGLIMIINGVIWILGVIFLINNLGYNVTTLVAGLGIGGIAIALAAQAILGDLFSYFVIFFDRPFEIGDFIVVDDKAGVIEHIGIKTTRIRTLAGEQLICSNNDLTNSRVHNYKRLHKRRIVFSLGVTYQTKHEQLVNIPKIVKDIIAEEEMAEVDRGHFSGYGDSSLNFEFVYYIKDSDYTIYMDTQQSIYLKIFKAFEEEGIEFAYPTQTLFIEDIKGLPNIKPLVVTNNQQH